MMRLTNKQRKVVIIGAGITGLTTAFYMQKQARDEKLPIDVLLIDASLRAGGKIETLRQDGYIIERGPESFYDQHGDIERLAQDLYIRSKLINNNIGTSYIALDTKLYEVPRQFSKDRTAPHLPTFVSTELLSVGGKVRALKDIVMPRGDHQYDESVANFFKRRFGQEVLENVVEPLLAGTFAGDIEHLSMKAMFPEFYALEAEYRSLLRGFSKAGVAFLPNEVRQHRGVYQTFENGLQTLVESLEESLAPHTLRKGLRVSNVEQLPDATARVHFTNGDKIHADEVIVATPFAVTKNILSAVENLHYVTPVKSATIATVTMAFDAAQITKYQDALNFFVSRNSNFAITSCTFSHNKWDHVAPEGKALLRIYLGRVGDETIVELSDTEIEKIVLRDLEQAIGVIGQPDFTIVSRWKEAMPQYTVGHDEAVEELRKRINQAMPSVYITGSSYDGMSLPRCVAQGYDTAKRLITKMTQADYTDA
ncbi:protoporphyrinogen oxidase [Caryophanon tenue]|uniref:Coproporphyrinogen III oxidase n=2 Tax=Caryophanon tenue TaxID=33978 RepID=A0A1C0YJ82_9BACL|nr:protoporphyrinogen oxidase [Caryophanon tenue]